MDDDAILAPGPSSTDLRTEPNHQGLPGQLIEASLGNKAKFVCDVERCHGKTFKRAAELRRHQENKHSGRPPLFSCLANDCNRTGSQAFQRADKRNDHALQGHGSETKFGCPNVDCSMVLTRDLMSVHTMRSEYRSMFPSQYCRKCPMPGCCDQMNLVGQGRKSRTMDDILVHLQEKHNAKGRMKYGNLLASRGYDAQTGTIVCPMCPTQSAQFIEHTAFQHHFASNHLQINHSIPGFSVNSFGHSHNRFWRPVSLGNDILRAIYPHRRVLLSLWPALAIADNLRDDIKKCPF